MEIKPGTWVCLHYHHIPQRSRSRSSQIANTKVVYEAQGIVKLMLNWNLSNYTEHFRPHYQRD